MQKQVGSLVTIERWNPAPDGGMGRKRHERDEIVFKLLVFIVPGLCANMVEFGSYILHFCNHFIHCPDIPVFNMTEPKPFPFVGMLFFLFFMFVEVV